MKKQFVTIIFLATALFRLNGQTEIQKDSSFAKLMPNIEIKAVRAEKEYPFALSFLSKRTIEKNNLGQDIPFLLNQVPGVVVNSDAGNGVGYTGIRIRGTDPSRINFTLNGIAYNDAESQGVFLVNLPDFLSSTNSIQIQRGVGTSTNGPGAFGASINLSTNELNRSAYGNISNSIGSFGTRKYTVKAGTGLFGKDFSVDVRLSAINSDGYIDRASSDLKSFYISLAQTKEKHSLRFNIFSGKEKTYQSWYGVSEDLLKSNRRFNSAGTEDPKGAYENETDNYNQTHYQFFYNQEINSNWKANVAVFATTGLGYYEQYKANQRFSRYNLPNPISNGAEISRTDLIRQLWLDNLYYGSNFSFQFNNEQREVIAGGGATAYNGSHFGKVIWSQWTIPNNHTWYDHDASKSEQHAFLKWLERKNKFSFFGDIQLRIVGYTIDGFRDNPDLNIDRNWLFVNPKTGIRYTDKTWSTFISYAIGNKEPNRDDFEAGANEAPKHETLQDLEVGFEKKFKNLSFNLTLYSMSYKNQLVLNGRVNDVGAYTRVNVPRSYRRGIEIEAIAKLSPWLTLNQNLSLSQNKIKRYSEFVYDYAADIQREQVFENTDIAFSPNTVYNASLQTNILKNVELRWITKYVGRQFLDNSSRRNRSLDPFLTQDLNLNIIIPSKKMKSIEILAQLNNIWNNLYEPNGYTYTFYAGRTEFINNFYYPMAGRNFLIGINLNF
jgi:iron complex outermembrane receptor protein